MDLSLRLLRAFLAVAEEGAVGRAAKRLFVSQPALSQDIRRLERLVGVELFVRDSRGMTLTAAGQVFAEGVRQAVTILDRTATMARRTAAGHRPGVTLAYTPSVGNHLLPLLLPELERRVPDVEIDERQVDTGEAGPAVESGRCDLALAHCPEPSPLLHATVLVHEPLVAAVAADHPLARDAGRAVALSELAGLDLLLWPRDVAPAYHDRILEVCREAGLAAEVRTGPRRALTRSYLLAQADAFALLPTGAAALRIPDVAFLPIQDREATVDLVLLCPRDEIRPEAQAVATAVSDLARRLSDMDAKPPT